MNVYMADLDRPPLFSLLALVTSVTISASCRRITRYMAVCIAIGANAACCAATTLGRCLARVWGCWRREFPPQRLPRPQSPPGVAPPSRAASPAVGDRSGDPTVCQVSSFLCWCSSESCCSDSPPISLLAAWPSACPPAVHCQWNGSYFSCQEIHSRGS